MDPDHRAQLIAEAAAVAKTAPPTVATGAVFLGYPVSDLILWLTFIWWVWLLVEKISDKIERRKKRK